MNKYKNEIEELKVLFTDTINEFEEYLTEEKNNYDTDKCIEIRNKIAAMKGFLSMDYELQAIYYLRFELGLKENEIKEVMGYDKRTICRDKMTEFKEKMREYVENYN